MLRRNTWVWHWDWTAIVLVYTLRTPSVSPSLFTNPFATRRTSTSIHINLTGRVGSLEKLSSSAARDGRHQLKGVKEETAAEPGTQRHRGRNRGWAEAVAEVCGSALSRWCHSCRPAAVVATFRSLSLSPFTSGVFCHFHPTFRTKFAQYFKNYDMKRRTQSCIQTAAGGAHAQRAK